MSAYRAPRAPVVAKFYNVQRVDRDGLFRWSAYQTQAKADAWAAVFRNAGSTHVAVVNGYGPAVCRDPR